MERTYQERACDMDGVVEGTVEIRFSLGRVPYVVDLCPDCDQKFRMVLMPFVEAAAKSAASRALPPGRRRHSTPPRAKASDVRAWAIANGVEGVSDRGRVSRALEDAYLAAQR